MAAHGAAERIHIDFSRNGSPVPERIVGCEHAAVENLERRLDSNGVSSSGGRVRRRIMAAFCGKDVVTTRALGPSGSGKSTSVSAPVEAIQAEPETSARPPAPACPGSDRRAVPTVLRIDLPVIVQAL